MKTQDSNLKKPGELVNLVNFPGYLEFVLRARSEKRMKFYNANSIPPNLVNEVHKFTTFFKVGIMPKRGVRGVFRAVFGASGGKMGAGPSLSCEYVELSLTLMRVRPLFVRGIYTGFGQDRWLTGQMCELCVNFRNGSSQVSRGFGFFKVGGGNVRCAG
jgi:hypothetical protein